MTSHAETAKRIREELKKEFPNIKFTVRSRSFSMGDDVTIDYTNGVPRKQVEAIVNKYQEGHFDGMTDMYEYSNSREDIPQVKYVMVDREYTPEVLEETKKSIAQEFGISDISNEQEWFSKVGMWSSEAVYRNLAERTL